MPFRFEARGYSMIPFIRSGDVVTISPLPGRRTRFGDVVAFAGPAQELVVHRVTARPSGRYEIRADNSGSFDDPAAPDVVPATAVLGVVTRIERDGRRVRLGLGPERALIAMLVRLGWLQPLVGAARAVRATLAGSRAI